MLTLYDPMQLAQVLQPALNAYLTQRFNDYPECCIVLSIGDTLKSFGAETGYHLPKHANAGLFLCLKNTYNHYQDTRPRHVK